MHLTCLYRIKYIDLFRLQHFSVSDEPEERRGENGTPREKLGRTEAEAAGEKPYELEAICEFPGCFCACYHGRQTFSYE